MLVRDTCLLFYHLMFVCFFQICIINKAIGYTHFGCLSKQVIYFQIIRQKQLVCLLIYVLDLYHHGYLQLLQRFCHSSSSWASILCESIQLCNYCCPLFSGWSFNWAHRGPLGCYSGKLILFISYYSIFCFYCQFSTCSDWQSRCQWALIHVQDGLTQEKNKNCKDKKL